MVVGVMQAAGQDGPRWLRRSDVVFMYDNPKLYEAYGCSVLGWAGRADAEHIRRAHEAGVRRFSSSVGFLTEFRSVIDFSDDHLDAACRNFAGEPFIVPWLWDHKHKGKPAYWWCTNSPLYRKYLAGRLEQVIAAKPDGLHIDDYRGASGSITWHPAGGFCRHCLAAFRTYLAENVAKEKLAELGIKDIGTFDYRKFLLARGVKPEEYTRRRGQLPLAAEFYHFHVMAATRFVGDYHKRAQQLAGRPVGLSVNSGMTNPQALAIAPHLSNFCCEVRHDASRCVPPTHPVYVYKLADGLGRPVAATASGQDWAYIAQHKLYGLVRTWTAMSYAFGHNFMAPHRQWCYTEEKGTHWSDGPAEQYAWPYLFARSQQRLLDGYEALARVAVIYDNRANRAGKGKAEPICEALAVLNVPFEILIAGDDWLPDYRLQRGPLARAHTVVVPEGLALDPPQRKLIDRAAAAGKLVLWPEEKKLAQLVGRPVVVEGAQNVWALPRAIPGDRSKPVVVHLLNRNYDAQRDAAVVQKNVTVRLARDLVGGRSFTKAVAHAPKAPPVALRVGSADGYLSVTLPQLGLWAIVELGG